MIGPAGGALKTPVAIFMASPLKDGEQLKLLSVFFHHVSKDILFVALDSQCLRVESHKLKISNSLPSSHSIGIADIPGFHKIIFPEASGFP